MAARNLRVDMLAFGDGKNSRVFIHTMGDTQSRQARDQGFRACRQFVCGKVKIWGGLGHRIKPFLSTDPYSHINAYIESKLIFL